MNLSGCLCFLIFSKHKKMCSDQQLLDARGPRSSSGLHLLYCLSFTDSISWSSEILKPLASHRALKKEKLGEGISFFNYHSGSVLLPCFIAHTLILHLILSHLLKVMQFIVSISLHLLMWHLGAYLKDWFKDSSRTVEKVGNTNMSYCADQDVRKIGENIKIAHLTCIECQFRRWPYTKPRVHNYARILRQRSSRPGLIGF